MECLPAYVLQVDCQKDASAITVPHYAADLRSQIWKHGVKGYYDYVMGLMDSLRTEPLNVAAIGRDNSEKTGKTRSCISS